MRLLVLGATGMLGHKLCQRLAGDFEVVGTVRVATPDPALAALLGPVRLIGGVAADRPDSVEAAVERTAPAAIVNCIGIVKQAAAATEPEPAITVNALLPHRLARLARAGGARLIQISTDCVFSGRAGPYAETDSPDPVDLYGRTKLLGEVDGPGCLTLRTSIVGRELRGRLGLVEWFLARRGGAVDGYRRALLTAVTTAVLADLIGRLLRDRPDLTGLWHVAGPPISKFELLRLVDRAYGLGITVRPQDAFLCDRRLDGSRFAALTGWEAPSWEAMIDALRADPTPYPNQVKQ